MNRIVAVDDKLANIRQALEAKGYQVAGLDQNLQDVSVVVVSGMDDNLVGDQTATTKARVIEAAGMSAEEVVSEVERSIKVQH